MTRLCFCYTSSQLNYQDCDHSWNSIIEQQHRREELLQPYMVRLCFSYTSSQLNIIKYHRTIPTARSVFCLDLKHVNGLMFFKKPHGLFSNNSLVENYLSQERI